MGEGRASAIVVRVVRRRAEVSILMFGGVRLVGDLMGCCER